MFFFVFAVFLMSFLGSKNGGHKNPKRIPEPGPGPGDPPESTISKDLKL